MGATLASGSIDLKAQQAASQTATSYITTIDGGGIKVHDSANQNLNYIKLTSNGMEIFKTNGATTNPSAMSVASFGSTARIGATTSDYVTIDTNGLTLYHNNTSVGALKQNNNAYYLELLDHWHYMAANGSENENHVTIGCYGGAPNTKNTEIELLSNGANGIASLHVCDRAIDSGTGSVTISPEGILVGGDIYINSHFTPIGTLLRDSASLDIDTAGVNNFTSGVSENLDPGSYIIVGECTFPGREGSPTYTNLEVQIYNQTNNVVLGSQRVVVYKNAETHLQATTAVTTTAESTDIYVRVSSGSACLGCTTKIRVMRIA